MNELQIFDVDREDKGVAETMTPGGRKKTAIINISGIDCYEQDGTAYLRLETVARGLGFTETAASGNECVKWSRVRKYLTGFNVIDTSVDGAKLPDFIPENVFYRLAMKAKNATAEAFQAKIADEVIPSIRKHGAYITPDTLDKAGLFNAAEVLRNGRPCVVTTVTGKGQRKVYDRLCKMIPEAA